MLKGAVGAATVHDHTAVRDYLGECDQAAQRIGDRNDYWLAFGPTNIAIHRVWLATEMGDPTDALTQAEHVDETTLPPELAERRASHMITVGWSHYLRRHHDEALAALGAAQVAAPEQTDIHPPRARHGGPDAAPRPTCRRELRELVDFVDVG